MYYYSTYIKKIYFFTLLSKTLWARHLYSSMEGIENKDGQLIRVPSCSLGGLYNTLYFSHSAQSITITYYFKMLTVYYLLHAITFKIGLFPITFLLPITYYPMSGTMHIDNIPAM